MLLILLTDVAHNVLSWLHAAILADDPCADFGTLRMVQEPVHPRMPGIQGSQVGAVSFA